SVPTNPIPRSCRLPIRCSRMSTRCPAKPEPPLRIGNRFTVYILLGLLAAPLAARSAGSDVARQPGRLVRRDEVVAAIFSALRANGIPEASTLLPSDIHFTAPVTVSTADAELQVR